MLDKLFCDVARLESDRKLFEKHMVEEMDTSVVLHGGYPSVGVDLSVDIHSVHQSLARFEPAQMKDMARGQFLDVRHLEDGAPGPVDEPDIGGLASPFRIERCSVEDDGACAGRSVDLGLSSGT